MKEILIWIIFTAILFIGFLAVLISGLVKKKRKFVLPGLITLLFFVFSASWTAYLGVSKSYNKMTDILKPRTGEEIYSALFGKTDNKCVKVLNHQDQVVPKIDYAILLHFETCPDELKRILLLHDFEVAKESSKGWQTGGPLPNDNWFKPETLGDSVFVFTYKKDESGNGQTIFSSLDSTEAYCIDVHD